MRSKKGFDALDAPCDNKPTSSAVVVESVELSPYRYEELWFSVEQIADPKFPLCGAQSSYVKNSVVSMCAPLLDYRSGFITAKWSAKCNATDKST